MSASLLLLALAAQQISIPLTRPKAQERLPASVETAGPAFARACPPNEDADRPAPPVRLLGNSYYVGSCRRSAVLITGGPAGHVLIDSGTERSSAWVVANIRALGFRPEDIRLLLHSNEHPDQIGGHSRLQRLSGAAVVASAASAPTLRSGRVPRTTTPLTQLPVDRIVADGETVRLGALQLTAMRTPGRTPGALSWRWVSCEGAVCRTLVYAAGLRPLGSGAERISDRPDELAAARASAARIAALDPCDLMIPSSPLAGGIGLPTRFAAGGPLWGERQCRNYAEQQEAAIADRVADEAAKPR